MPPLSRHALVLVALATAIAGLPAFAQKGTAAALPKFAKKALDDQFKNWEVAAVDPQAVACNRDGGEPQSIVQADFNSDGQQDIALAVKTGDDVRLVAILARLEDSTVVNIDSLGRGTADGYLGLEKRGMKFKSPESGIQDFFAADTLAVYRCGKPKTTYFWAGTAFMKVIMP